MLQSSGRSIAQASVAASDHKTKSSAERIVSEIKQRKGGALILASMLLAAFVAVAYFAYAHSFAGSGAPLRIRSVAVLPFVNAGNEPDSEYLSDGLSERLIDRLAQLPQLKVIARSSSFKYRGDVDVQQVANALGVETIVTGRVTQHGDSLNVRAELVDARNNTQLWSNVYNRQAVDLQAVQENIAQIVSEKLRLQLSGVAQQQLARRETVNPEAYELLLKGRFYDNKGGAENTRKAIEYYQRAIAVDPNYALAYANLSFAYSVLVGGSILDPKEFTPKAKDAAQKALDLDDNVAEAHYALARLELGDWKWANAEHELKRSIELNPNLSKAYINYAYYLSVTKRPDQAPSKSNTPPT